MHAPPTFVRFAALLLGIAALTAADARERVLLNDHWQFALENEAGEIADDGWQAVTLPHSWNVADSRDKREPYHRGSGRYRRTLHVSERFAGKRLYLYFEGANQVADVYVNDRRAGRHVGGYTAFAVDLGGLLEYGATNRIEVRVDNRHDPDIPPLNADFTFYGGIYRDVYLLVLDPVHFELDEFAANGLQLHIRELSRDRATIDVQAQVANDSDAARDVVVETVIRDADDRVLAQGETTVSVAPGETHAGRVATLTIREPSLWSPESPYLYRVVSRLRDDEQELDRLELPLGLRWFDVTADGGFRLNGEPYPLYGTNRHQDIAGLGNALPDARHREDLRIIKHNGFNFLRLAHYPQDPAVLEAADELGLIVWEEIPVVNLIDMGEAFRANSARMLREMIRQHRQHPSVVFWGYMNEVTLRKPDPVPDGYYEEVVALAHYLDAIAKEEDPARPTVMALSRDEIDDGVPLEGVADVLAFNLYFGWYYEEFATLGRFLDNYHREHPEYPLMVSEYGAGSDERVHARDSRSFDFSTEYQQRFHEENFRQILDRPWLVGSAVWNQFDFGSNHRQDTKFAINQKGLWYYDRQPKDIAAWYRAQLVEEPVLHIATRDWPRRAGSRAADAVMPVKVYTNAAVAELFVNGESAGRREVENGVVSWNVRFRDGQNRLRATSGGGSTDDTTVHYEDRGKLFRGEAGEAVLAVNAGGHEQIVADDGLAWEADRTYEPGNWGYVGGEARRSHHRVFGTALDPLYQTRRRASPGYRFDVADGRYRVSVHFAALGDAAESFAVIVNDTELSPGEGTPWTARAADALVEVRDGQGIVIDSNDPQAAINGIVLRRISDFD